MTPIQVKSFIKSVGTPVNVVYGATTICMHNGKLLEVSPQGQWVVIKHFNCNGNNLVPETLGFYLTSKPTSGVKTKGIKRWHLLRDMRRIPTFPPKFGPPRAGTIRFGDFIGFVYSNPTTDCNNGRFLYAVAKNNTILNKISPQDVNIIKSIVYSHWNWSAGAPRVGKFCLKQGTNYRNYWIAEQKSKSTIKKISKG